MDAATLPATRPPPANSNNTLNNLIEWINNTGLCLTRGIHESSRRQGSTQDFREREMAIAPKLQTIKHRNVWLDRLLKKFLKKYGETNISEQWKWLTDQMLVQERGIRDDITNVSEADTEQAIQISILTSAAFTATILLGIDVLGEKMIVEVAKRQPLGASGGKTDIWVYITQEQPIFHFEAKSTRVLHEGNIGNIKQRSQFRGDWRRPDFKWPIGVKAGRHSTAKKMIIQLYSQLLMERIWDRGFQTVCALSNYNKTIFCLYGGHLNSSPLNDAEKRTLFVSTPQEPKMAFLYSLAIIMHEYERFRSEDWVTTWGPTTEEDIADEEKEAKDEKEAYDSWAAKLDIDPEDNSHRRGPRNDSSSDEEKKDGEDEDLGDILIGSDTSYRVHKPEGKGDGGSNSKDEENEGKLPLESCKAITYDWDVMGPTGERIYYTDRKSLLPRIQLGPSSASAPALALATQTASAMIRNFGGLPHLVFTRILGQGVVGQVLRATCSGHGVDVAVKLVDLANQGELRKIATHEAKMYEGPLLGLQGDVVPRFYGLFSTPRASLALLVLEDVGMPLPENSLSEVDDITKKRLEVMKARLKKAGVQHQDLECRNVCRDQAGNLKIIDFSHARRVPVKRKLLNQQGRLLHQKVLLTSQKQSQTSKEAVL